MLKYWPVGIKKFDRDQFPDVFTLIFICIPKIKDNSKHYYIILFKTFDISLFMKVSKKNYFRVIQWEPEIYEIGWQQLSVFDIVAKQLVS